MLWENVEISLQATMYGHLARVWKAIMLKDTIASIGEVSHSFWNSFKIYTQYTFYSNLKMYVLRRIHEYVSGIYRENC